MKKLGEGRTLFFGKKNKSDNRGSAIVVVIIAMALIGILATTIMWSAYLNYRIKINDLKTKNSFYSAETVVEQIMAGVKKEVVSEAIGVAYQDVISNWDSLGTDSNRESYFITAYIEAVMKNIKANPARTEYDKTVLYNYVDAAFWNPTNAAGHIDEAKWNAAGNSVKLVGYNSIVLQDIRVEFYDGEDFLSIINTDIAIDVPKLRFTQAGDIDRLYPYVLIGDTGIESEDNVRATINGSIYGGVDKKDKGGIQIGENSTMTIENASYVISGGDIVVGSNETFKDLKNQGANLIIRNMNQQGKGYQTNIYAKGLAVNGSHMDAAGKLFVANDLLLSGIGSSVSLSGQYYGYGDEVKTMKTEQVEKTDDDGNVIKDGDGNSVMVDQAVNPANSSSAIVINGQNSAVNLTGLKTLQLAGRAYVSLPQSDEADNGLPHILMGESISVKSNQIAYLVPPECVGTLDGRTILGQNPISFSKWSEMLSDLSEYEAEGQDFRIVDASREAVKLGGEKLITYGIADIRAADLGGVTDSVDAVKTLNLVAAGKGVRFLYMPAKQQVYLYLVMDADRAEQYFAQYYNVNSNKASLDSYFNKYVSGGIKLGNTQGYTLVGNSMVSVTDEQGNVLSSAEGGNLVKLMSSITKSPEGEGGEGGSTPPAQQGGYQEVSDNVETLLGEKDAEELKDIIENCGNRYKSLLNNLMEEEDGREDTVFENLIRLNTQVGDAGTVGLQDYLDDKGGHDGKVEFTAGDGLKAVLVDSKKQPGNSYAVTDSDLRLVIAIGDVEVKRNFKGLIIASGKITIAENVTIESDGAGVYDVLQAQSEIAGDTNVPANILYNGSGMIKTGYEDADIDASGNLNIDYSKIVRYENWIKK